MSSTTAGSANMAQTREALRGTGAERLLEGGPAYSQLSAETMSQ